MPEMPSWSGVGAVPRETGKPDTLRPGARHFLTLTAVLAIVTGMVATHYAARGTRRPPAGDRFVVPAADPDRGRAAFREYGCVSCHVIPGVPGAEGRVGPRLDRLAEQAYLAGVLANSPQNLVEWLRHPKAVNPLTAMPDLGVTEADARDMAAYLYAVP